MLWLVIALLTTAFYFIEHGTQISRLDGFAVTADEMVAGVVAGDTGRRLAFPALGLCGALLLARRGGRRLELRSRLGWLLLAYVAWAGISILWSDDLPLTLRHFSVLLFCGTGALGIARQVTMRELCLIALAVTGILLVNGVCLEIALGTFQPFSAEYRFAGTLHPNGQAAYCVTMALAAACLARHGGPRRILFWMLCLIGVVFLLLTKSRTGCGAFFAAPLVCGFLALPLPKKVMALAGIISLASALLLASSLLDWDIQDRVVNLALIGRQEEADSLSGRIPLWTELTPHVHEHFLFGHGYQTFWNPERIENVSRLLQWAVPNGHCAYLDLLLDLGAIGSVLCLATAVTGIGAIRRRLLAGDYGYEFLFVLIVSRALNGILESTFAELTSIPPFIMVCGILHLAFYSGADQFPGTEELAKGSADDPVNRKEK